MGWTQDWNKNTRGQAAPETHVPAGAPQGLKQDRKTLELVHMKSLWYSNLRLFKPRADFERSLNIDNNLQDDNKKSNSTTTGFPTLRKTTF